MKPMPSHGTPYPGAPSFPLFNDKCWKNVIEMIILMSE